MQNDLNHDSKYFIKPPYNSVKSVIKTALGRLEIDGPIAADVLKDYRLADGLNCFRPSARQHTALVDLAGHPDGLVFTASLAKTVISYVSFQKPDYAWWQKRCLAEVIELGGLETDLAWRKMGITKMLMDSIFKNPDFKYFEDYIVLAVQFVHTWDLANTNLAPWAYREFMIKLFTRYNFTSWETVDPEIREHPCNILLARVGENVDSFCVTRFSFSCLGTRIDQ